MKRGRKDIGICIRRFSPVGECIVSQLSLAYGLTMSVIDHRSKSVPQVESVAVVGRGGYPLAAVN